MLPRILKILAMVPCIGLAKKPKRNLAENLPGLGGGLGKGPPWRAAIDKVFTEACEMNRGRPSVFCFPDKKELLEGLQVEQWGLELTDETFLMDLYVVVDQLLQWPPAWADISDVLSPKRGWTQAFCDKIIGGEWWKAVPMVRKSFLKPRQTLVQLERESPQVVDGIKRWLDMLRSTKDSGTRRLIKELKESDAADVKNRSVRARPMMQLMQHVHAKAVYHIMGKACKGSAPAWSKFKQGDVNSLSLLHHAVSLGDLPGTKAILRAIPKAERAAFAAQRDMGGYTAEDWARLGDYPHLADAIRELAPGPEPAGDPAPPQPVKLFAPIDGDAGADTAAQCAAGSATCSSSIGDGGWRSPTPESIPTEWMPPSDAPCFADTINVAQFDFDTFMLHYVLHSRPLLIRGGAQFPEHVAVNFTRSGLLKVAGERKVSAQLFPDAKDYDGSSPVTKSLAEYVESLEARSAKAATKKLHYVYSRLAQEEVSLNFSATLPRVLADKVEQGPTHFYVGGLFMGTPPHHHGPAANSLVYGAKLWFFDPPGREFMVHETMYDYLVRTQGAPGSLRCLQHTGDLLYVPRAWTHSAICLGDCVGVSHEFSHERWDLRE
mmetsp:Transcript_2817/g.6583  ORF Transcript_2817/g.6583 Transcript_2817/m.6583 type:complete len:605 (-) Transcript_2817:22-1836(-)